MNPSAPPHWVGLLAVVVGLLSMLGVLRWLQQRRQWAPETARKMAHVGLGLTAVSYPFLFRSAGPVIVLGVLALGVLSAMRWLPAARREVGVIVHSVSRRSGGELFFPIATTILFLLARGQPLLYVIPVLTLTTADAVAALVGVRYGQVHFGEDGARKSLEGSVAFFVAAFLAAHVPLLLFSTVGRTETLLISVTFGLLVMLLEAVSWSGLDNLFIPFGGYALLRSYLTLGASALVGRLAITVLLLVLVTVLRRTKSLGDSANVASVLLGYVLWALGGWTWLVPPLLFFLFYNVVFPRSAAVREHQHQLLAFGASTGVGLFWLLLFAALDRPEYYFPFTIAFAANFVSYGITWYRDYRRSASLVEAITAVVAVAWAMFLGAFVVIMGFSTQVLIASLLASGALLLYGAMHVWLIPHVRHRASAEHPWLTQATMALLISALALVLWSLSFRWGTP